MLGPKGEPKPELVPAEAPSEPLEPKAPEPTAETEELKAPEEPAFQDTVQPEPVPEPSDLPPIPAEEAMPEELPPVEPIEPVAPEAPAGPEMDPVTAEKAAKLKAAYDAGKIPKELYEKNLARLTGSVPVVAAGAEPRSGATPLESTQAPAEPEMDPVMAEKIKKLDKALADGKITQELYDKNVARIKSK